MVLSKLGVYDVLIIRWLTTLLPVVENWKKLIEDPLPDVK